MLSWYWLKIHPCTNFHFLIKSEYVNITSNNVRKLFDRNILNFVWENHSVTHDSKEICWWSFLLHPVIKWFSSLSVVIFPLWFKAEDDVAALSEAWQMFPYIKWILEPSRERPLFSTSWGVLQQLQPLLFISMSLWNNQKIKFMDKSAFQCVCIQSIWSVRLPFVYWDPVSASAALSQRVLWSGHVGHNTSRRFPFSFPWLPLFPQNTPLPLPACSSDQLCHSHGAAHGKPCKPSCSHGCSEAGIVHEPR